MAYKYGAFINYNKTSIDTKKIEYIQLSFGGHHMISATIRLYPNGEAKAYRRNHKSEKKELVLIKEWEISKEEQKRVFNIAAELNFPDFNEPKKPIRWMIMPHSTMHLSLQMKSGETISYPNDSYFPSKTIDKISEISGKYYKIGRDQISENFKKNRTNTK